MVTEDKQRSIVLLRKEFKAGRVFEGKDGIFLCEANAVWVLESVEICEEVLNERGAGRAAEEEGALWVFIDLRFSLSECSLRSCILGLSALD